MGSNREKSNITTLKGYQFFFRILMVAMIFLPFVHTTQFSHILLVFLKALKCDSIEMLLQFQLLVFFLNVKLTFWLYFILCNPKRLLATTYLSISISLFYNYLFSIYFSLFYIYHLLIYQKKIYLYRVSQKNTFQDFQERLGHILPTVFEL